MIRVKLTEIAKLQDISKKDDLNYKSKRGKTYHFGKYFVTHCFLRYINEGYLSLENADHKQSNLAIESKNFEKGTKVLAKNLF